MSKRFGELSDQEIGILAAALRHTRTEAEQKGLLEVGAPTTSLKLLEELLETIDVRGLNNR